MNSRPSLHPRHWSGWLTVLLIHSCAYFPLALVPQCSRLLGDILRLSLKRRRQIAQRNLEVCFPELTPSQRQNLLKSHFRALGMTVFESAWSWAGRPLQRQCRSEYLGMENLQCAPGQGLLIVSAHMTSMDLGSALLASQHPVAGVYRPARSAVLEWYHTRGRLHYAEAMLSKNDFGALLRRLNQGKALWYAPDQDFGAQRSIFVPFFGRSAATLKATWILARRTGAKVVTMFPLRLADGSYRIEIGPPLDTEQDAHSFLSELNRRLEQTIRQAPEQYWWVHRRFKTRPPGRLGFYDLSQPIPPAEKSNVVLKPAPAQGRKGGDSEPGAR